MKKRIQPSWSAALAILCLLVPLLSVSIETAQAATSPAALVNPFVGTAPATVVDAVPGGLGAATQPDAVVPFGMIQLGPDTDRPERSGYSDLNTSFRSFSFTHMSGPGCQNMGEVPFLPFVGDKNWPQSNQTTFQHSNQKAGAGFYQVKLDSGTLLEMTATERTGIVRFTFPQAAPATSVGVLINPTLTGVGPSTGEFKQVNPHTLVGSTVGGRFCANKQTYTVYYAIEFSRDSISRTVLNGVGRVEFLADQRPLVMRVGLSYVSTAGAFANLHTETKDFDFDRIRNEAFAKWDAALSVVQIGNETDDQTKSVFYTALYHSLLHPNIASDVNGNYMGFDNQIHNNPARVHYVNYSGWDIYRSQVQLLAFLFPQKASDMAQSLVDSGAQCGALPKWALNNLETNIMIGDPGALSVANFYAFGATNFDHKTALGLIKRSALDPAASCQGHIARPYLSEYHNLGYIPYKGPHSGVASILLEYASADYGISQYADAQGDSVFAQAMSKRSKNWKNIWDSSSGLMRPRAASGQWLSPFSPTELSGFIEGNAAQYSWMVPFDLATLVQTMGGDAATVARLDKFMLRTNAGQKTDALYIGNEPGFGTPWVYLWAHAPHRAQATVREILKSEFRNEPGGLAGNDDLGALSSWYVWSALGLFPEIPGKSGLVIGSPSFSSVVIHSEGQAPVTIAAPSAEANVYVESLNVSGSPWKRTWISLKDLRAGKDLQFNMNKDPQAWGSRANEEPPGF